MLSRNLKELTLTNPHTLLVEDGEGVYETAFYGFNAEEVAEIANLVMEDKNAQAFELWCEEELIESCDRDLDVIEISDRESEAVNA